MPTQITSAAKLAEELNRLASHLETAADGLDRTNPNDKPARGRLANEYAILAGDRLLLGVKGGAIQDRLLLACLDVGLSGNGLSAEHVYQKTRNKAFLAAALTWLPTAAPDHRPDKHNIARWYVDDLRALADTIVAKDAKAEKTEVTTLHSPDFRSVIWYGVEYTFTRHQAVCVEFLWAQWEQGTPECDGLTVIERVPQARFVDVFKAKGASHPALGAMIVIGSTKGAWRLAEPK